MRETWSRDDISREQDSVPGRIVLADRKMTRVNRRIKRRGSIQTTTTRQLPSGPNGIFDKCPAFRLGSAWMEQGVSKGER